MLKENRRRVRRRSYTPPFASEERVQVWLSTPSIATILLGAHNQIPKIFYTCSKPDSFSIFHALVTCQPYASASLALFLLHLIASSSSFTMKGYLKGSGRAIVESSCNWSHSWISPRERCSLYSISSSMPRWRRSNSSVHRANLCLMLFKGCISILGEDLDGIMVHTVQPGTHRPT